MILKVNRISKENGERNPKKSKILSSEQITSFQCILIICRYNYILFFPRGKN